MQLILSTYLLLFCYFSLKKDGKPFSSQQKIRFHNKQHPQKSVAFYLTFGVHFIF